MIALSVLKQTPPQSKHSPEQRMEERYEFKKAHILTGMKNTCFVGRGGGKDGK